MIRATARSLEKQFNKRFRAKPDYILLAGSTEQVIAAVEESVREGRRLVVTSGGHCLENFVSDPEVRVILDISPMKRVYYDAELGAIAVEAGATVGETFRALFDNWGTVIPLGEYPAIGMGGHVPGGAFGFLCRQLGLAADYLYAVEVVTVGETGRPGPWWRAERCPSRFGTSGGRTPAEAPATSASPPDSGSARPAHRARIPLGCCPPHRSRSPPSRQSGTGATSICRRSCGCSRNHGTWCERNSRTDSPNATLWALLELHRKQFGKIIVRGVSTAVGRGIQPDR